MGRFLELAKKTLLGQAQSYGAPKEPKPDPYAARMQMALSKINRSEYPAGMILWLETAHSDLYMELTSRIPDEINRLWNSRAPLEEFEGVLDRLVNTHREGCRLYREEKARNKMEGSRHA